MFKIKNILIAILMVFCLMVEVGCATKSPPSNEQQAKSAADNALEHRNAYKEAMKSYQNAKTDDEKQKALDTAKIAMQNLKIEAQSATNVYNNAKLQDDGSPLGHAQRAEKFLRQVELTCDADGNPKTDQDTLDQMDRWDSCRESAEFAQDDAKKHTKAYRDAMKEYNDSTKTDDERAAALEKMKAEKKLVEDAVAAADLAVKDGEKDTDADKKATQEAADKARDYLKHINDTWDTDKDEPYDLSQSAITDFNTWTIPSH